MKQLGLCTHPQGCVVSVWVSTDGHYAFSEFRSIEEAQAAIQYLNGMQIGSYALKIGRPKGYAGGASAMAVPMSNVPNMGILAGINPNLVMSGMAGIPTSTMGG